MPDHCENRRVIYKSLSDRRSFLSICLVVARYHSQRMAIDTARGVDFGYREIDSAMAHHAVALSPRASGAYRI